MPVSFARGTHGAVEVGVGRDVTVEVNVGVSVGSVSQSALLVVLVEEERLEDLDVVLLLPPPPFPRLTPDTRSSVSVLEGADDDDDAVPVVVISPNDDSSVVVVVEPIVLDVSLSLSVLVGLEVSVVIVDVDAVSEPDDESVEGADVSVAELDCPLVDIDESSEVVEAEPESDVESAEDVVVSVAESDSDVDAALPVVEVEPELDDERVSVSLGNESLEVDNDVADPDPELVLVISVDELSVAGSPRSVEVTSPVVELEPSSVEDASLVVAVPLAELMVIGTVAVMGDPFSSVLVTVVRLVESEDASLLVVADSESVEVIASVALLVALSSVVLTVMEIVSVTGDPLESVLVTVVRLAGLEASSLLVTDPEFVVVLPSDSLLVVLSSTVLGVMGIVVVIGDPLVSVLVTVVRVTELEDVSLPVVDPEFVEVLPPELPVWEGVVEAELVVAEVLALSEVPAEVDDSGSVALPEEAVEVSELVNVAVLEVSKVEVSEGVLAEDEMVDPLEVSVLVLDELSEPDELVAVTSPLVADEETETESPELVDEVAEEEVEVVEPGVPVSVLLIVDSGRELEDVDPDELGPLEELVGKVKLLVGSGKVITGYDMVVTKGVGVVEGGQSVVEATVVLGHLAEHRQAAR
ncbi:hypothetical protein GQX73_g6948 [Xylaria multiplex]|uniref:Uncharacterized protein n=1 Tax=Xylaria multiplex TaxID=323545 RepID=A0A7C8MNL2_9PEZI|nr:hypothetical protein GQX73_g6948 [Xylaria multiplex]